MMLHTYPFPALAPILLNLQQPASQPDDGVQLEVRCVGLDVGVHLGPGGVLARGFQVGGVVKVKEAVNIPRNCAGISVRG